MRLLLLLSLLTPAFGGLIDRVVAVVGRSAITDSQVRTQIRIAALIEGKPSDESESNRDRMRDRLIEQQLISNEMRISRLTNSEPSTDPQKQIEELEKAVGGQGPFDAKLLAYHLTEQQLRTYFQWQSDLLRFVAFRFRPAVQISDAEVQAYYDTRLAAADKPPLDEVRPQIEEALAREQVNKLLDRWLSDTRQQVYIETYAGPGAKP